jgi:quinol monooxygenase YgiN
MPGGRGGSPSRPHRRAISAKSRATAGCYQRHVACCPILELRQYTLHPGARDTLVELFDREFVETQEAEGMRVVGQFRDLDRPDRFVWLRGFPDMVARARSLAAFYGGPIWKAHRDAANATMIDSDNVLLLRPVRPFSLAGLTRDPAAPRRELAATIISLDQPPADVDLARFDAPALAVLATEPSPNTFPALPVREGEHVIVVLAADRPAALPDLPAARTIEVLRLAPTPRSLLR